MSAEENASKTSRRFKIPRLPLTKLYTTDSLPSGKPGELIRVAEFGGYDLPIGAIAYRFLYHSRSTSGADVASSGVVLVPSKKVPTGGWPVIAWAHDSAGVARQCAPSLQKNLQHGSLLAMYVNLGYAVVASDYTGLGTEFRNAGPDFWANAWDIIDSIPAARSAVPQLGSNWIAVGTRQGAMAAIALDELERETHDSSYLGSIAIGAVKDMDDMVKATANPSRGDVLSLIYGIETIYPKFKAHDVLAARAIPAYQEVTKNCAETATAQDEDSDGLSMLKPGWQGNLFVKEFFLRNRIGSKRAAAPLLIVSSADDPSTATTVTVVARLCQQGDRVQFQKYPEYDPGRVIGDSARDQISWIQTRLAGRVTINDCAAH